MTTLAPPKQKIALTFAAIFSLLGNVHQTTAGPLCDWLCGRTSPAPVPYAAGYPVAVPYQGTYAANYPVTYAANYPVAGSAPYAAAYAPGMSPVTAVPFSGAAALQMPPYASYYGNSAGAPAGDRGYVAVSPGPSLTPSAMPIPVTGAAVTSFYGTGNVYPANPLTLAGGAPPMTAAIATPQASYYAPQGYAPQMPGLSGPVVTATSPAPMIVQGTPAVGSAAPAGTTVQTYPGVPAANPGFFGGLSRFFGGMFGTGYSTSYYAAPVTYYRPVTTVDPATGTTTIVQRPCTSSEYLMQRTPIATCYPNTSGTASTASSCCGAAPTTIVYNPYAPAMTTPLVPNAGSMSALGTSASPWAPGVSSGNSPADLAPVGQPQLGATALPQSQPVAPYPSQSAAMPPLSSPPSPTWAPRNPVLTSPGQGSPESQPSGDGAALNTAPQNSSLIAPPLLPSAQREGTSGVRPIPAADYPYPRSTIESQPPLDLPPPPRDPLSQDASQDRVALAHGAPWGYEPIQWGVQKAVYEQPRENIQEMKAPVFVHPQRPASPQSSQRGASSSPGIDQYQKTGWSAAPRR